MNIKMIWMLCILFSIIFGMRINAAVQDIIKGLDGAYEWVFESIQIKEAGNTILVGILPARITDVWKKNAWVQVNNEVVMNAQGDQDLIGPWNIITKQNDAIMTIITEWHTLLKKNPAGSVIRQSVFLLENALKEVQDAYSKLNKTFFVRTNKKETAQYIKRFAELLMKVGIEVKSELQQRISAYSG